MNENEEENEEEIVIENGKVAEVEPFAVYRSSNPRVTLKEMLVNAIVSPQDQSSGEKSCQFLLIFGKFIKN